MLHRVQDRRRFYCQGALQDRGAVDHFVPWSRYSLDLGYNFVLARGSCNTSKSDRIAAFPTSRARPCVAKLSPMSDESLRELERTWRQTGDPAHEERWHLARVRAGELEPWRLEVARTLGWPTGEPAMPRPGLLARLTLRDGEPARLLLRQAFSLLLEHSDGYDRVLVAACEHALASNLPERSVRELRCHADELAGRLLDPGSRSPDESLGPTRVNGREWWEAVGWGIHQRLQGVDPELTWLDGVRPLGSVRPLAPPASLFPAVARELVPWLLGTGDPLQARAARALDEVRIASPCAVPWESMVGDERARRCEQCQLTVYDIAALSRAEASALLRRNQGRRLCVNLYRREDGRIQTRECPVDPARMRGSTRGVMA